MRRRRACKKVDSRAQREAHRDAGLRCQSQHRRHMERISDSSEKKKKKKKKKNSPTHTSLLSVEPEVTTRIANQRLTTICIACDGVFEVLDSVTVLDLARGAESPQAASDAIVRAALAAGTGDNVSVVTISVLLDTDVAESLQL
jgi:serine/threonine protein phosphatase PrpC